MAIIDTQKINEIIMRLQARDANLYHACQLKDFRSYIELGGIPSRNKLINSGLEFTEFDTDRIDKENQVWDKVFGNFSDFGWHFTKETSNSQPNPYGPIQIILNPNALRSAIDLSITLRSAGAQDFDRDKECLKEAQEIELIFQHIDANQAENQYHKKNIAFAKELNQRFNRSNCTSPEFNCKTANELLSLDNAIYIIVDHCNYKNRNLAEEVRRLTNIKVFERKYLCLTKKQIIWELSTLSANNDCRKIPLITGGFASEQLKAWARARDDFHYDRFIRYLTNGTTRA